MTSQSERIGTRVREARLAAGLKQEALAFKAGVAVATVSRLENGKTAHPREDEFARIAAALGTTPDALMGIKDEPGRSEGDDMSLVEAQRRIATELGVPDAVFGFVRVAQNRDRVSRDDWAVIELAIKAAAKRLARQDPPDGGTESPD